MVKTLKQLVGGASSPRRNWWLIAGIVTVIFGVFMASIAAAHHIHIYSSDDVAQQTILLNDGRYGQREAWLGVDNFILKLPLYQVINGVFGQSRTALLATTLLFNAIGFCAFVAALYLVWRDDWKDVQKKISGFVLLGLLALLWFASLGGDLANALINPNVRNAEIGICLLLAVLIIRAAQAKTLRWWLSALLSIVTGLFLFNDPYFLFTLFLALAAVPLYYFFFEPKRQTGLNFRRFFMIVGGALLAYKLSEYLFLAFGLHVYANGVTFAHLATIGTNLVNVVSSFVLMFHANFFGQPVMFETIVALANAAVAFWLLILTAYYGVKQKLSQPQLLVFVLTMVLTMLLYVLTTNSDSASTSRYFVILPFALVFLIPFVLREMANIRLKRLLIVLMTMAALLNIVSIVFTVKRGDVIANRIDEQALTAIQATELTKGYTGYWAGNTVNYFSHGNIMPIPVTCTGSQLQIYYWLMDTAWLSKPADSTFLLVNTGDDTFTRCDDAMREAQFGTPERKVIIDEWRTLYLYDYDILTKMPPRTNPKLPS